MDQSRFHASTYRIGCLWTLIFFSGFLLFVAINSHYQDSHRTAVSGSDMAELRQSLAEKDEAKRLR